MLEAIAAAAGPQQLLHERVEVEQHRLVEKGRQVLKRNGRGMQPMDGTECIQRCIAATVVADAGTVGIEHSVGGRRYGRGGRIFHTP